MNSLFNENYTYNRCISKPKIKACVIVCVFNSMEELYPAL